MTNEDVQKVIDQCWAVPILPFRTRAALSGLAVYLLLPIVLAVVSSQLA